MAQATEADAERAKVSAMAPLEVKEQLHRIAYERSEPTDRVSLSEVVREALQDYVDEHTDESAEIGGESA